jgi:hypothetical protein
MEPSVCTRDTESESQKHEPQAIGHHERTIEVKSQKITNKSCPIALPTRIWNVVWSTRNSYVVLLVRWVRTIARTWTIVWKYEKARLRLLNKSINRWLNAVLLRWLLLYGCWWRWRFRRLWRSYMHLVLQTNGPPKPARTAWYKVKPCRVMEEALFICIDAGKLVRSTTCMPMEGAQIEIQYNVIRVQSPTHVWLLTGFGFEAWTSLNGRERRDETNENDAPRCTTLVNFDLF